MNIDKHVIGQNSNQLKQAKPYMQNILITQNIGTDTTILFKYLQNYTNLMKQM